MLDMETLATGPDCVILTFGAVKFNPFDDRAPMTNGLYLRIDVEEQLAMDRKIDPSTVEWWGQQADSVREEALGDSDRISIESFTAQLNKFIVGAERIWAQGPVFDIVILENLYRQIGKPIPWHFYTIRDSRTLLKALGDNRKAGREQAHNALADCIYQAEAVQAGVKTYGLTQL